MYPFVFQTKWVDPDDDIHRLVSTSTPQVSPLGLILCFNCCMEAYKMGGGKAYLRGVIKLIFVVGHISVEIF